MSHEEIFTINNNGFECSSASTLFGAIGLAKGLLNQTPTELPVTFSVMDSQGKLLASLTNRRITGEFMKQQWNERDQAVFMGTERFDATDYILWMPLAQIKALQDNRESTDDVGQAHVSWGGPHQVMIVESVCDFFGVESLDHITGEALAFAMGHYHPKKPAALSRSAKAGKCAIEAHTQQLGIEGDLLCQITHLLVSVQDFCAQAGIDFQKAIQETTQTRA